MSSSSGSLILLPVVHVVLVMCYILYVLLLWMILRTYVNTVCGRYFETVGGRTTCRSVIGERVRYTVQQTTTKDLVEIESLSISKVRTKRVSTSTPVHPIIHPTASHDYVSTNGSTYDTSDIPNNDDGDDAGDILHNNTIHIAILIGLFVFLQNHHHH